MRPVILAVLLVLAGLTRAPAQTMPEMPPTTFPEPGSFCGFLTMCTKATEAKYKLD